MTKTTRPQPTAADKLAAFMFNENAAVAQWRATGGVYPGRSVVYPEDPWGELAGTADTTNPWWVQESASDAIGCAITAITPWDVSVEFFDGKRYVYVFDAEGNEVIPEQIFNLETRADIVVATVLNLLSAHR